MSELYNHPKYYEIAFSFRDIPAEVDVFEGCFKRFSKIPVKSVLELGSGNSPHMDELAKRGYRYNGLDLSKAMLKYARQKALHIDAEVTLSDLNSSLYSDLERLEPTGSHNPTPVFVCKNVTATTKKLVGANNSHLKLTLADESISINAIGFNMGYLFDQLPQIFDVAFEFELNEYRGNQTFQLKILDVKTG